MFNCQTIKANSLNYSIAKSNQSFQFFTGGFVTDHEYDMSVILMVGLEIHYLIHLLGSQDFKLVRFLAAVGDEEVRVAGVVFAIADGVVVFVVGTNEFYQDFVAEIHVVDETSFGADQTFVVQVVHADGDDGGFGVVVVHRTGVFGLDVGTNYWVMRNYSL